MKRTFILNRYEVAIHSIFWLLFFSTVNIEWGGSWFDRSDRSLPPLTFIIFPIFFYANLLWLLPQYFKIKTIWKYLFISGVCVSFPEMFRILLSIQANGNAITLKTINSEIWNTDSLLFGTPSPVWFGFFLSSAYFLLKEWLVNSRKLERLEKEKVKMELSLLKSQISPHFIFNSLNTLDGLIEKDSQKARSYLMTLSKVYRFSTAHADKDVITLKEEWEFATNYIELIKERFGGAYRFEVTDDIESMSDYLIPPSAIQGLVENVIKHNRGDVSDPLEIQIRCSKDGIFVSNQIRLKATTPENSGVGLNNLRNRYRLLVDEEVEVISKDTFTVRLPLIQQETK